MSGEHYNSLILKLGISDALCESSPLECYPVLSEEGSQLLLCCGANGQSIMQEKASSHQLHSEHILPLKSSLLEKMPRVVSLQLHL